MSDSIELNIINLKFRWPKQAWNHHKPIFSNYDKILANIPAWADSFYEMRNDESYNQAFNEYKNTRSKEAKTKMKEIINQYHLSQTDFITMVNQYAKGYEFWIKRQADAMYDRIESAFISDKALGFCLEELNKKANMIELLPVDEQFQLILDVDQATIQIIDEQIKIPPLTLAYLRYLKGKAVCQSVYITRGKEVILNIAVDCTVELPSNISVYKKQNMTRATFEKHLF